MVERFYFKIYFKILIILLSLKWIFRINLGDIVIYKGKEYAVNNGVARPSYHLVSDDEDLMYINIKDFKKKVSLLNYINSFKSGYNFYMNYWYDIWVREGIKGWMRGCNIW